MDAVSFLAQIFASLLVVLLIFNLTRRILLRVVNQSLFTASGRCLDKFEEVLELFSTERHGSGNSCYVMTLHSKEKLEESRVRKALTHLAKRQPLLRAVVKTVTNFNWLGQNEEKYYFEIIEPSKVRDMIDLTTSDLHASQWQNKWYDIITRPRDETGLLWQALLFKEERLSDSENYVNTVLFRANHSIMDGVSGMKLCKQFLRQLNRISEVPRESSEDVPSLELLPSFYDILNNTRPWSFRRYLQEILGPYIVKFVVRLILLINLATKPEKPYDFFNDNLSPEQRDLVYNVFSEGVTSQIRRICKKNGATVTGALMAATQIAYCNVLESQSLSSTQKLSKQKESTLLFPINGLRLCKPPLPEEYLGNYALCDKFFLSYESNKDNFWSLAQEATTKIHTILKEEKYVANTLDGSDIFTPREVVNEVLSPQDPKKQLKQYLDNGISSAGAFTFDEDDTAAFKLYECLFYSIPFEAMFSAHYNTTVNGKMAWAIVCSGFLPSAVQKQFAKYCFDTLVSVVNEAQS